MTGTGKDNVASYVVRIYRRAAGRGERTDTLTGLVEAVADNQQRAFHDMAELWEILRAPGARRQAPKGEVPASSQHPETKVNKRKS